MSYVILKVVSDLAQDGRDAERREEARTPAVREAFSRNWRLEQNSEARSSVDRWKKEKGPSGRGNIRKKYVEFGPSRGINPGDTHAPSMGRHPT